MYVNDTKTKRAVERDLEIIGEAVNRIIKKEPEFPISDAYQIIGTRNRIIHGYDVISNELIWSNLEMNIPKLKKKLLILLVLKKLIKHLLLLTTHKDSHLTPLTIGQK